MLNDKQQEIYNEVLNSDKKIFMLTGSAGTGKSFVLGEIAKDYPGEVLVTATTNKAKALLANNTGLATYTTHSALGFRMTRNGLSEYLSDVNEPRYADLLIIDEYSMLPQSVWKKALDTGYSKILLVGDDKQLPAIGLKATIEPEISVTLTQQMRQENNTSLASFLEEMRKAIEAKRYIDITKNPLIEGIELYDNHRDFCNAYLACSANKRILAYSNRVIDSYNLNIKQGSRFDVGDLLVLDKPLGKAKNGDIVEILSVNKKHDYYELVTSLDGTVLPTFMVFKTKSAEEKILKSTVTDNPVEALEIWNLKDKIMHPKHLYASTIHKAQGQSIDEVFIDVNDIYAQMCRKPSRFNNYNKPISVQDYMKLLYVAISRMKTKAHLFIGSKRDYKILKKGK